MDDIKFEEKQTKFKFIPEVKHFPGLLESGRGVNLSLLVFLQ